MNSTVDAVTGAANQVCRVMQMEQQLKKKESKQTNKSFLVCQKCLVAI